MGDMLLFIILIQAVFAVYAVWRKTDLVTDLSYGWTFFVLCVWLWIMNSDHSWWSTMFFLLVSLWASRLAVFLFLRVLALWKDKRFDGIREQKRSFIKFWILQIVVICILSIPLYVVSLAEWSSFSFTLVVGWIMMIAGLVIETVADRQKFQFKQQFPTLWCNIGLWSRSRHPNYFGELLVWRWIFVVCISISSWWRTFFALLAPVTITWLLLFVTWIPPLERHYQERRWDNPEWQTYVRSTYLLLPMKKKMP